MPRTFNYTGRRKILREQVTIRIIRENDRFGFTADLRLDSHHFPSDARVYVEAYRGISALWKRFDFGRVGLIESHAVRYLDDFNRPEGILFRVKVSAEGDNRGRLLGEADGIRPERTDDQILNISELIEIGAKDLGGEPWQLNLSENGSDVPFLYINERLEHWQLLARQPEFREWTATCVIRQILTHILVIDAYVGEESDDNTGESFDWRQKWLRYAELLPNMTDHPPVLGDDEVLADRRDITEWIDQAVSAFGMRSGLMDSLTSRKNQEAQS